MENINQIRGNIHSIETFGLVDGPGVRFVVFMKGCKMRCKFCHNTDTWNGEGQKLKTMVVLLSAEENHCYK